MNLPQTLAEARRRDLSNPHGTIDGFLAHQAGGEQACTACRNAWKTYWLSRTDGAT